MKLWIFGVHLKNKLYDLYLKSPEWKAISDECKRLANFKCNRCDNTTNLHAHHLTYDNIGEEKQEDLECLCLSCHEIEHDKPFMKKIKGGFNMIYHKSYEQITEEAIKSNKDLKLFNWITNRFTYNKVEVPLVFTECPIDVSQPQFSRMIKQLNELDYIMRVSRGIYRLNPFIYVPFRASAEELQHEWETIKKFKTKPEDKNND